MRFEANLCRWEDDQRSIVSRHINIKTLFGIKHRLTEEVDMDRALTLLGIELIGTHHRGVDDAYNAARILDTLL